MTYVGDGDASAVLHPRAAQQAVASARVLAPVEVTGGAYTLYRLDLPPHAGGAQPHFHRTFVETFTVLAGVVTLFDGSRWVEAGVDDHLHIPPGGVHGFRNDRDEPATMLMASLPGVRREAYFAELVEVARAGTPLTPEQWTDLYARHDQYMV